MITVFVVPTNHVQQFWHLAEEHLQRAIEKSNNEYTIDQLKLSVVNGEQILLIALDDNKKCKSALVGKWHIYPNDRVFYISYIGGRNTKEPWSQFVTWVKESGGTAIHGSTKFESIVKLWNKFYGFKPKYTLMELKLNTELKL